MRGKGCCTHLVIFVDGITPAYAGKRCHGIPQGIRGRDHPRVCEEKQQAANSSFWDEGSPPRMRGKDAMESLKESGDGITPACAGKSLK